jgi:transcriptional regulator with XRE-family HTH domain
MLRKTGNLRAVPADAATPSKTGERLKALREALDLSQEDVLRQVRELAETLGPNYSAIPRETFSKFERQKLGLKHYEHRHLIARALGFSTDDLSAYLDERLSLPELLSRKGRPGAELQHAVITYAEHAGWETGKREAMELDPSLTEEDFAEVAPTPVYSDATLNGPIMVKLGDIGRMHRARRKRGQGTP